MSTDKNLRSREWFGKSGKDGFIYRAWMRNQGFPPENLEGKPVIGICNTWSELTPCNAHLRDLAEVVKRGVWEAGGLPLEFPVMSLGETLIRPTAMLYRNLASMDVEESIRANPLDGVILMCGCDKTTPSLVMGACSVDIPSIVVSGGPMLTGKFRGEDIGTTDVWRFAEEYKVGDMSKKDLNEAEGALCRSAGHCAVMGTASTMASMVESLGISLPGNAAIPAVDARRKVLAHQSGKRIVEMVEEDVRLSSILTRKAFINAVKINAAIGGSTNFIIHLMAIARRIGVSLELDDFDRQGSDVPLLVNLKPSGDHHMEEFYYSGGLPAVIAELKDHLDDNPTVNGQSLIANNKDAPCYNRDVIARIDKPVQEQAGITVVRGNLCPDGAVIKTSAASPELLKHRGPAVVFESIEDYHARIDDPALEVDENSVLVLKYVGPKGYPGMAEVGNMALPKKLLEKGVKDMVRISDGRMSGTAYGTAFLHVSPESYAGGNLALVQNGDLIEVDVENKRLHLNVSDEELEKRRKHWSPPAHDNYDRGYVNMYIEHVEQADLGADMDFLTGSSGSDVKRESH